MKGDTPVSYHVCACCGHRFRSATPKDHRFVLNAVKVNKRGPYCDMCGTGIMFIRFSVARGLKIEEAMRIVCNGVAKGH